MSVVLDGTRKLWEDLIDYIDWITLHSDEIHDRYLQGDENAELIVDMVEILADMVIPSIQRAKQDAILMIATERYIHDYHPEIATIKGGYPKDLSA